ncbi:hypothetical protein GCM10009801_73020 [Streptomyces albiaxialis]|uniref:Uncharacterized protein n=1 Tax=Streptomyces albiaxialis TaxID=329523 RepID=A0ABP5IL93_9ACTN
MPVSDDEPTVRKAVQAYYRLCQTTDAALQPGNPAPEHAGATVEPLAYEANRAMRKAGLFTLSRDEFEAVVQRYFPDFKFEGGSW